jgi:hypothetical protein
VIRRRSDFVLKLWMLGWMVLLELLLELGGAMGWVLALLLVLLVELVWVLGKDLGWMLRMVLELMKEMLPALMKPARCSSCASF